MKLEIKRNTSTLCFVEIDESTVYSAELLGQNKISASFYSNEPLKLQIEDFIVFQNQNFSVKTATNSQQIDSKCYKNDVVFYSEIYVLYDELVTHLNRTTFTYTGTPIEMLVLIIDSLTGWSVGECANILEPQTFSFAEQSCRTALTDIANAFSLEYFVENKKIYLVQKIGTTHNITLEYGKGKGLHSATRNVVDKAFSTVWLGFGGNQNIPSTYRNGLDRIAISAAVERNVSQYGRKKGSVTFPDVFPKRTGIVSSSADINSIVDASIDFDINAQIINESAKIVFKTGELGGQEFVITSYNHTTKKIVFGYSKDDSGYVLPNATFSPKTGDTYTLTGIVMPQSYIDAAEAEVLRLTILHAEKNSSPPVAFLLDIDEKYIREMGLAYALKPGDSVRVKSIELGIWQDMRLQSISYPLCNPCKVSGVVSDTIQYTTQELIAKDIKEAQKEIAQVKSVAINSRKIADEIANAAIINQFEKTYIGDLAVLSGAFVVGNPVSGQVGGLSGEGTSLTDVVFFAGSTFAEKNTAKFRVQRDGKAFSSSLDVMNGCKIGAFEVADNILYRRSNTDSFAINTNYSLLGDYFLFRKNAGIRGQVKEITFNLNSAVAGSNYAVKIENSINTEGFFNNVGLYVYATGAQIGGKNIALQASSSGSVSGVRNVAAQLNGELEINGSVVINSHYARSVTYNVRLQDGSAVQMIFDSGFLI